MIEGGLYSSYIANCVFNAWTAYTAIMLNSVTIHVIRKTTTLPKPLKTLLLSLAVSDLGVGLLVQPLYSLRLVVELEPNVGNNPAYTATYIPYLITANLFGFASFFGVMVLSVDRFLAIHLHLRYQELVTHKRVFAVVISVWAFSAVLSLVRLWIPLNIIFPIFAFIEVACVITAAFLNYRIFVAVRRHVNQIQALQVQQIAQNEEVVNVGRLRKSATTTVYVYLVFLVCYLPNVCYLCITVLSTKKSTVQQGLSIYNLTLTFLNSSLNPLIYCWKMRDIRQAVRNIFRNAFSCDI